MSTHKHFDKICCVILAATLLLTVVFMNCEKLGVARASTVMGYESKLFDSSTVHTIDIIMDSWDEFTENCTSEEYYNCTVVIDNEAYKNVAIRGKGNTSLTQVASYGNDRYSFKIEFDHYDSTTTYHGLDKLCLNNIIQDNTYMKDYLSYTMMNEICAASPLCSYVYITVNGEDWGLYLAVEGIEDAFLQRNYGRSSGELYKPDSTDMGGGRGNGRQFDFDEFMNDFDGEIPDMPEKNADIPDNNEPQQDDSAPNEGFTPDDIPQMGGFGAMGGNRGNGRGERGFDGEKPKGMEMPEGMEIPERTEMPEGMERPDDTGMPNGDNLPGMNGDSGDFEPNDEFPGDMQPPEMTDGDMPDMAEMPNFSDDGKGFGGMMSSDDVLLKYIDDDPDSYANIFENAKTDITDSDKARLIEALRKLSKGEELESTVDIDEVIKYFVVHNFVLNFDSYTGSMIHNYYLYESNGQLQMIPWDYNLAFGGFQSMSNAESLVNYPIDTPVSGGSISDRPMLSWIFDNEEYTELYHEYFSEFISEYFESGYFTEMIDNVTAMLSPYVSSDPTKFCTYEEFEQGAATLKEFCTLRAESIHAQLDGTIGSTSDTQESSTLISAEGITISDMGSMNNSMGGGFGHDREMSFNDMMPDFDEMPNDIDAPGEDIMHGEKSFDNPEAPANSAVSAAPMFIISIITLILGVGFALIYSRRRYL